MNLRIIAGWCQQELEPSHLPVAVLMVVPREIAARTNFYSYPPRARTLGTWTTAIPGPAYGLLHFRKLVEDSA
jgi:hypothetical protein